jgi:hypothetical protein
METEISLPKVMLNVQEPTNQTRHVQRSIISIRGRQFAD